jgi:hypothetical protein
VARFECETFKIRSNVTVMWISLQFHTQEVMGSDLGLETGYPKIFMVVLDKCYKETGIKLRMLPSIYFTISYSLIV